MSEFIRCEVCQGKKTILGLGTLEKKCEPCMGVGYVKPTEISNASEDSDSSTKRKRKAKWESETL